MTANGQAEWVVFDYGVGNLHSLTKALAAAGARVRVTTQVADLADAGVAVLPGVGAFGAVMARLAGARPVLRSRHAAGRPIVGICIGQQVLYEASEEAPGVPGLGILKGTVRRLPAADGKVPHMGWNTLQAVAPVPSSGTGTRERVAGPLVAGLPPGAHADPLFAGLPHGPHVYYVHSFAAPPDAHTVATTRYGMVFCAALRAGATVGLQFHPEKSSAAGQQVLRNLVATLGSAGRDPAPGGGKP